MGWLVSRAGLVERGSLQQARKRRCLSISSTSSTPLTHRRPDPSDFDPPSSSYLAPLYYTGLSTEAQPAQVAAESARLRRLEQLRRQLAPHGSQRAPLAVSRGRVVTANKARQEGNFANVHAGERATVWLVDKLAQPYSAEADEGHALQWNDSSDRRQPHERDSPLNWKSNPRLVRARHAAYQDPRVSPFLPTADGRGRAALPLLVPNKDRHRITNPIHPNDETQRSLDLDSFAFLLDPTVRPPHEPTPKPDLSLPPWPIALAQSPTKPSPRLRIAPETELCSKREAFPAKRIGLSTEGLAVLDRLAAEFVPEQPPPKPKALGPNPLETLGVGLWASQPSSFAMSGTPKEKAHLASLSHATSLAVPPTLPESPAAARSLLSSSDPLDATASSASVPAPGPIFAPPPPPTRRSFYTPTPPRIHSSDIPSPFITVPEIAIPHSSQSSPLDPMNAGLPDSKPIPELEWLGSEGPVAIRPPAAREGPRWRDGEVVLGEWKRRSRAQQEAMRLKTIAERPDAVPPSLAPALPQPFKVVRSEPVDRLQALLSVSLDRVATASEIGVKEVAPKAQPKPASSKSHATRPSVTDRPRSQVPDSVKEGKRVVLSIDATVPTPVEATSIPPSFLMLQTPVSPRDVTKKAKVPPPTTTTTPAPPTTLQPPFLSATQTPAFLLSPSPSPSLEDPLHLPSYPAKRPIQPLHLSPVRSFLVAAPSPQPKRPVDIAPPSIRAARASWLGRNAEDWVKERKKREWVADRRKGDWEAWEEVRRRERAIEREWERAVGGEGGGAGELKGRGLDVLPHLGEGTASSAVSRAAARRHKGQTKDFGLA